MGEATSTVDYELELIAAGLAGESPGSGERWQAAFEQAQSDWQLERARQLLRLVKSYPADARQRSVVRRMEAGLLTRLGDWAAAEASYRSALTLSRTGGDRQGELSALTSLVNLSRRGEGPWEEVIVLCY